MRLLACGSNGEGQLGLGHSEDQALLKEVIFPELEEVDEVHMAFGGSHTLVLTGSRGKNRRLYGTGSNRRGQLGSGSGEWEGGVFREIEREEEEKGEVVNIGACWETSLVVVRRAERDVIIGKGSDDWGEGGGREIGLWRALLGEETSCERSEDLRVLDLAAGLRHVVAHVVSEKRRESYVIGWGAGRHGQTGNPGKKVTTPQTICVFEGVARRVSLVAGKDHSAYLDMTTGEVTVLGGRRDSGRRVLSWGDPVAHLVSTWTSLFAQLSSGALYGIGSNLHGQLTRKPGDLRESALPIKVALESPVAHLTAGSEHLLSISANRRTVNVWGWNEHGNLGVGDAKDRYEPVAMILGREARVVHVFGGNASTFVFVEED